MHISPMGKIRNEIRKAIYLVLSDECELASV